MKVSKALIAVTALLAAAGLAQAHETATANLMEEVIVTAPHPTRMLMEEVVVTAKPMEEVIVTAPYPEFLIVRAEGTPVEETIKKLAETRRHRQFRF